MAPPVKNCAQQGVYAPDAAPYDFYRGTAHNVCNSASKGGSLLQSTYTNKVIGLIALKSLNLLLRIVYIYIVLYKLTLCFNYS